MPTNPGAVSRAPEAWHEAVERCLRRFDEDYRPEWKAGFAAGERYLIPVFLDPHEAGGTGTLMFSPGSYEWLPGGIWEAHGVLKVLDDLAKVTGQTRGTGSNDLVPKPDVDEDGDHIGARLIGMAFAGPEWRQRHEADCPDHEDDDEELSESLYVAFTSGDCYVRRYMGSDKAVTLRSYVNPLEIDKDAMNAQAVAGSFCEVHLDLFDLLNSILCTPESARKNYGSPDPSNPGAHNWMLRNGIPIFYPN